MHSKKPTREVAEKNGDAEDGSNEAVENRVVHTFDSRIEIGTKLVVNRRVLQLVFFRVFKAIAVLVCKILELQSKLVIKDVLL